MILHDYYRSSTSYRLRIALNLKGLDFERAPVNLRTGENHGVAYLEINPFGSVPALEDNGTFRYQSLALLAWLDETFPDPPLLPAQEPARQICRELYYGVASEIHAVNNLPILKYLGREFGADQAAIEAWYETWIHRTFAPVEQLLSQYEWAADDFPFGQPSLFEIVLVPQIYNAQKWKTDLSGFPLLTKINAACAELDAFKKAHPDIQSDAPGDA